jgi:hypothetical protein
MVPLLRRTFSSFQHGERRQLGERARAGGTIAARAPTGYNAERAMRVVPLLQQIFEEESP